MTTTAESCVCECEECLALRAAEDAPCSGETVTSFEHDGSTYEIDHLGIGFGSQWGEFEVYCDGEEVAEFTLAESALRPGSRPAGLPVSAGELVRSHALGYLRSRLLDLEGTSAAMHLTARIRCVQRRHPGAGLSPRSVRSQNAFCRWSRRRRPPPSTLPLRNVYIVDLRNPVPS